MEIRNWERGEIKTFIPLFASCGAIVAFSHLHHSSWQVAPLLLTTVDRSLLPSPFQAQEWYNSLLRLLEQSATYRVA